MEFCADDVTPRLSLFFSSNSFSLVALSFQVYGWLIAATLAPVLFGCWLKCKWVAVDESSWSIPCKLCLSTKFTGPNCHNLVRGCGYNCSLVIFGFFEWWCFIKMKRKFVLSGLWLGNFLRLGPFRGQCVCGKCVELSESSRFFTFPPVSVTGSVNIQHPLVFEMTKIKIAISHWWVTWQPNRQSRKGRSRGGLFHQSLAADVEVLF